MGSLGINLDTSRSWGPFCDIYLCVIQIFVNVLFEPRIDSMGELCSAPTLAVLCSSITPQKEQHQILDDCIRHHSPYKHEEATSCRWHCDLLSQTTKESIVIS